MSRVGKFVAVIVSALVLAACASGQSTSTRGDTGSQSYSNFLVIAQAPRYNTRASFERMVVSGIRERGASATAHHVAAGGDEPISRESLLELVAAGGYDAVLVTRVMDTQSAAQMRTEQSETLASRRQEGGFINLFRYDYREVTGATDFDLNMSVTLESDVYDSGSESMVWSSESTTPDFETMAELIDNAARTTLRQLARSRLIAR